MTLRDAEAGGNDALRAALKLAMAGGSAGPSPPVASPPVDEPTPPPWSEPPAPEPPPQVTPLPVAERPTSERCVFVGASGAGKTCTLAALDASCYVATPGADYTMSAIGDGDADDNKLLARYAIQWIAHDQPPPTSVEHRTYQMEIATRIAGRGLRPARLVVTSMRCTDGPGGSLFPHRVDTEFMNAALTESMLRDAAAATTLVVVVDATAPPLDLIETHLPRLLDRIARPSPGEALPQRAAVRWLNRFGFRRGWTGARRTQLATRRVLLLLTKIDVVAQTLATELAPDSTPAHLVRAINPVALAIGLLGPRPLCRIRRALGVHADFAVGLASAAGFVRDGRTFLDWARGQTPGDRLKAWEPYGINEALLYIATGRCEGPVERVGDEVDLTLDGALALDPYPFEASP